MAYHSSHKMRVSTSSHFDTICETCGIADGSADGEALLAAPCGMPEQDEEFFKNARKVAPKQMIYKLMYGGGGPDGKKWLEFITLIGNISYKPGWYFRTGVEEGRMWFQVGVTEEAEISFDPIAGKNVPWRGAKHYLSPHMCRNEVVTGVKHAIDRAEMHEVNEWFRYRGRSIYNPHIDPDALVEVARYAKNFNVREGAMQMED